MGSHGVWHDWSDLAAAAAANEQEKSWVSFIEQYTHFGVFHFLDWIFHVDYVPLARKPKICFHFLPLLPYFPASSKEDGWTQVQSMLINLPHPYTPPHVHTKRKNPAWFLSLLSSILTATLCPLGFTEDLPVNPTCDRTKKTPCVSKESSFFFFFSGLR